MNEQIKLIVGTRLTLCTKIVKGKFTFLRADEDLGDARHMGYDYSKESNALHVARMRVRPKDFWKNATSFVDALVVQ
jgi:hypothetical protein